MIESLQSFQNIFKIPELKRRVIFTVGLLVAYRIGAHVPTPGIDGHALAQFFDQVQGTLLGMVDLFSGGNLRRLSIFALGIMPYISASIILQLLTVVIPALEKCSWKPLSSCSPARRACSRIIATWKSGIIR